MVHLAPQELMDHQELLHQVERLQPQELLVLQVLLV
jgi:hypothetical protein